MKRLFLPLLVLIAALQSCQKGGVLAPSNYYGDVQVAGTVLSGQDIDVFFNGQKAGTLKAGTGYTVSAGAQLSGSPVQVSLYKGGTTDKIKDTLVNVRPNATVKLEAIYSDLIGLYGFWNSNSLKVAPDSVRLKVRYVVTSTNPVKPPATLVAPVLQIITTTSFIDELNGFTLNLTQNVYSADFTVSRLRPGLTTGRNLVVQFKNPATGALITEKIKTYASVMSLTSVTTGGHFYLVTITIGDDPANPGYYKMTSTSNQII